LAGHILYPEETYSYSRRHPKTLAKITTVCIVHILKIAWPCCSG